MSHGFNPQVKDYQIPRNMRSALETHLGPGTYYRKMLRPSVLLLFGLTVAAVSHASADDQSVVFRSDVSLVRVDVQVLDRDNRAVQGLRAEDFVLRDEGRVQPIRNFVREKMPIDVLFLFDVSASMRPHVQRIANAASTALDVLNNKDRVGIMVFDRSTRVRLRMTSSRSEIENEMDRMLRDESFRGGTDITRGMLDAADYIGRNGRKDARRAIIILTDDQTEFERDEQRVGRALERADAVMMALIAPDAMANRGYGGNRGGYPGGGGGGIGGGLGGVIFGQPRGGYGGGRRGGYPGGGYGGSRTKSAGTSEIARDSGGDSMSVDQASALDDTLSRLRQRYALYFLVPPGARAGEERSIEVSLSSNARRQYSDADVRYRRTYISSSDTAGSPADVTSTTNTRQTTTADADAPAPADTAPRRRRAISEPDGGPMVSPSVSDSGSGPYSAPSSSANSNSSTSSTRSSRSASSSDDDGPPVLRRAPSSSSTDSSSTSTSATPSQSTDSTSTDPNATPTTPKTGGWRKVKPGEQP